MVTIRFDFFFIKVQEKKGGKEMEKYEYGKINS